MRKIMLLLTSILLTLVTSIAFSALSTSLAITSEVKFRFIADIRINSVSFVSASNGAQIGYESDFSKNTVSNGFILPNSGSSISYRVHVDNSGDVDYSIYNILRQSSDNGLNVVVSGYNVQDVIPAKTSVDLILTYTTTNPSESVINVVETFDYRKVYHVTYETGTSVIIPAQVKYEGVNLTLTSQEPTKNGYTFTKWNTESDGTGTNYNAGSTYALDEDATLYARYTANVYNISYTMNDGPNPLLKPATGTYDSDVVITNPADKTVTITGDANNTNATIGNPTTNTQVFTGWTSSTVGNNAKSGTTENPNVAWDGTSTTNTYFRNLVESGTVTLEANWSGNGVLPTLTKRGNDCKWYDAATGGNELGAGGDPIVLNSNSPANVTVYAECVVTAFKVEYDTEENGGTGTIPEDYVPFGEAVDLTPTATKTGWTFVGWNTDKDATTALSSLTMGIDDITLYAIYRKEAVLLTANWHGNGATLSSNDPSTCNIPAVYNKAVQGTSCEVSAPTVTKEGYDLIGWNQVSSATTNDQNYNLSTNKLTITENTTGHTWYAITRAGLPLTATFEVNNGATASPATATCYLYGASESCQVTAPAVTAQTGFNHIGFSMNQNATSNSSSYNTTTNKLTITGDSTWYPITKSASQYTGTFIIQDPNAATQSGGNTSCYRYNGNESCNITAPTLTAKTGYEVIGWDKNQTGETAAYASGAQISIDSNTAFYSKTYYKTVVTITFNRNVTNAKVVSQTPSGGTASTETTLPLTCNKYNGATTCNITSPSMEVLTGYHAVGYATSASATTSSWNENTLKTVSTDATYYAITAGNTYTIRFNANCPSGITSTGTMSNMTMAYGTSKNLTANAFGCAGRVFDGWTLNAEGTGETFADEESVNNLTTTSGDIVDLYGRWRLTPPSPTISGGATKIYGTSATTLTCTENTTYPSGVVKYYSFGYATQENGTPSGWSDTSTSNTRTISSDAFIGERWYSCRVYASDGNEISNTEVSSNTTKMTLKNAKLTFNVANCGTISGTSPGYVNNTMTGVYTGATNTTAGTIPTVSRSGYTFNGWYASKTGKNLFNIKAVQSAPSNTASANTTKRTFTLNTAVIGLAYNNYYNPSSVTAFSTNNGAITMTAGSGYGVAYPILSAPNKTYTFSYDMASSGTGLSAVMYYQSDGTLIDYVRTDGNGAKAITFTTPANTYYVVLQLACQGSTTITVSNPQLEEGTTQTFYESYLGGVLPSGYTGVDYIESTTTQYIDTGSKFNTNSDKLELVYQATDADGNYMIAGSGNAETGKIWIYSYKNGNKFAIYATDTGGTQREFFGLTGTDTLRHTVLLDAKKLYVDGTMTADNSSYTFGETPTNMTLFKSGIAGYNAKTKIYSFKMWSSGTLTRDMVPCIKDSTGEAGMYDLVNNVFYGNSGTGEFIVGNSPRVISSDGTIQPGVSGWTDSNSKWLITEDRELVASCVPNYALTFISDGVTVETLVRPYGTTIGTLPTTTKTGYTFNGWFTDETGGTQISASTPVPSTDTSYYAHWTANTYTITLDRQSGSNGTTTIYEKYADGYYLTNTNGTLSNKMSTSANGITVPTRAGYVFGGYYTATGGGGTQYIDANGKLTSSASSTNFSANGTLYAKWTPGVYTITLNQQSGSGGTGTIYEKYGSGYYTNSAATTQMTTSANGITVPSRTGYTFGGYYTSTGGGGTQYIGANGKLTSSASSTHFTAAGSLYAKWTPVSYSISYNLNSGSVSGNPTSYTIETTSFTLRNPSRTGYTFTGWSGTGLSGSANTSVTVAKGSTGNRSYTANWSANSYSLDVNGLLGGVSKGSTEQCGTFDVYTNGTLRANDVNDYNASWVTGTTYSISDIKAKNGCTYAGVSSGSASGTITGSNVTVQLKYTFAAKNYGYTGGVQSFVAPISGTYKLQVWGAQGGYGTHGSDSGGLGGYSYGNKSLTAGNTIYVVIGGKGQNGGKNGGYNGGGLGTKYAGSSSGQGGGGGGATHIGGANTNKELKSVANSYRSGTYIYLVAGGGGGASEGCYNDSGCTTGATRAGGVGGGTSGGAGAGGWYPGGGATQVNVGAAGDTDAQPGGFGYGGNAADGNTAAGTYGSGGGGGGWYGGGGASHASEYGFTPASGGGGGSGYIGGVTSGATTAGQRSGSGYATISFVS